MEIRQEGNVWIVDTGHKDSAGNRIEIRMDAWMATGQPTQAEWEAWAQSGMNEIKKSLITIQGCNRKMKGVIWKIGCQPEIVGRRFFCFPIKFNAGISSTVYFYNWGLIETRDNY